MLRNDGKYEVYNIQHKRKNEEEWVDTNYQYFIIKDGDKLDRDFDIVAHGNSMSSIGVCNILGFRSGTFSESIASNLLKKMRKEYGEEYDFRIKKSIIEQQTIFYYC